jgi:hypothetical protein
MAQLPCSRKWFDPTETGLHDRMRAFIQAMTEAERESALLRVMGRCIGNAHPISPTRRLTSLSNIVAETAPKLNSNQVPGQHPEFFMDNLRYIYNGAAVGIVYGSMKSKVYRPNTNSACPAATAITWRPPTINDIGADLVLPPSETRQTSRPVSPSNAKQSPPDAPNTSPPSVESRPL